MGTLKREDGTTSGEIRREEDHQEEAVPAGRDPRSTECSQRRRNAPQPRGTQEGALCVSGNGFRQKRSEDSTQECTGQGSPEWRSRAEGQLLRVGQLQRGGGGVRCRQEWKTSEPLAGDVPG